MHIHVMEFDKTVVFFVIFFYVVKNTIVIFIIQFTII